MKKHLPLICAVIFLVISISIFFYVKTKEKYDNSSRVAQVDQHKIDNNKENTQKTLNSIQELDIVYGVDDAPVRIIEYASYGCSHCASFFNEVHPNLLKYIKNKQVQFVMRDFPLDEPSLRASQLVHCLPEDQRKDMIKLLFKKQENWAHSKAFPEKLENFAKISGMSGGTFHECMDNHALEEKILKSRMSAHESFNVNSTPSLIINGKKHMGSLAWEDLEKTIRNLL